VTRTVTATFATISAAPERRRSDYGVCQDLTSSCQPMPQLLLVRRPKPGPGANHSIGCATNITGQPRSWLSKSTRSGENDQSSTKSAISVLERESPRAGWEIFLLRVCRRPMSGSCARCPRSCEFPAEAGLSPVLLGAIGRVCQIQSRRGRGPPQECERRFLHLDRTGCGNLRGILGRRHEAAACDVDHALSRRAPVRCCSNRQEAQALLSSKAGRSGPRF
jgi:hypothetical protein